MQNRRVVITGIGPFCSIGNTAESFWKNLVGGKSNYSSSDGQHNLLSRLGGFDHLAELPEDVATHIKNNYSHASAGRSFGIGLACASSAVLDARLTSAQLELASLYLGSGAGDLGILSSLSKGFRSSALAQSNALPGIVARALGVKGPSAFVSTACATGIATCLEGFAAVKGSRDVSLVGAVEAPIGFGQYANSNEEFSSSLEGMFPFGNGRDGPVLGEGGAVLVFEELQHALERGANIYCEVLDTSLVTEFAGVVNPIHLSQKGYERALQSVFMGSGVNTRRVTYVNAHGSATLMNDSAESHAIRKLLGGDVAVSSFKGSTGHLQAGSSALELAGCALALYHGKIPATNLRDRQVGEDCAELNYVRDSRVLSGVVVKLAAGFNGAYGAVMLTKYSSR
ncbi:hypothetical protein HOC01_05770 [archaeon]|nr:hypothetical protein [archaeon]MBT6697651.1 hypothetical protein [archaeon]